MRPNRTVAADGGPLRIRTGRHLRLVLGGTLLAVALWSLLSLLFLTAPAALAAPFIPQPTPTLSLSSPTSGQGPVGAFLTVQGSGWTNQIVDVGVAGNAANCANPTGGSNSGWLYTVPAAVGTSNGSFAFSFHWPASLTSGNPYYLCAAPGSQPPNGSGVAASQTYTVRSSQPPTLSLSSSTVQVGQPFTITGSNFYGMPTINISINNVFNQAAQPDGNGSFIVTVTPTASQAGNANILAQSPPEGNAKPVLTATAQITILAPTATSAVTPSPSPSPSVEATSTGSSGSLGGGNSGGGNGGGNGGLIIGLIIAIVLVLLLIAGAVTFLVLRRRGGGGPEFPGAPGSGGPGSGGGWGGYPGPGHGTGPVPQYGQTGRYSATGAYGSTGFYGQQDTYAAPQMGGVAAWDDAPPAMGGVAGWDDPGDSAPGPDWQPRPMSNIRRRYDDPSYPPYAAPEEPPPDAYGAPAPGGYAPPPDPWGSPPGSPPGGYSNPTQGYGRPPQGYGDPTQGYAPPGRGGTGYPPNPNPAHRPPPGNWNGDDQQGGDWNPGAGRGPGGTNPTNQGW